MSAGSPFTAVNLVRIFGVGLLTTDAGGIQISGFTWAQRAVLSAMLAFHIMVRRFNSRGMRAGHRDTLVVAVL